MLRKPGIDKQKKSIRETIRKKKTVQCVTAECVYGNPSHKREGEKSVREANRKSCKSSDSAMGFYREVFLTSACDECLVSFIYFFLLCHHCISSLLYTYTCDASRTSGFCGILMEHCQNNCESPKFYCATFR